jgi:hypothetical protein
VRAGAVGGEGHFFENRDGKIARATIPHALVEGAVDVPPRARSVEDKDLGALQPGPGRSSQYPLPA